MITIANVASFKARSGGTGPVITPAKWMPSSHYDISSDGLTATQNGGTYSALLADLAHDSGSRYLEMVGGGNFNGSPYQQFGLALSMPNLYPGSDTTSWGYYEDTGEKSFNAVQSAYGASFRAGDVIGVGYNADNGTIEFFKNKVSQGTAFTGISGLLYPAIGVYQSGGAVTLRTTAVDIGSIPNGYMPWAT